MIPPEQTSEIQGTIPRYGNKEIDTYLHVSIIIIVIIRILIRRRRYSIFPVFLVPE